MMGTGEMPADAAEEDAAVPIDPTEMRRTALPTTLSPGVVLLSCDSERRRGRLLPVDAPDGGVTSATTVTMGELAAGVHAWQLPFLALLLSHSKDAAKLIATPDAWGRKCVALPMCGRQPERPTVPTL